MFAPKKHEHFNTGVQRPRHQTSVTIDRRALRFGGGMAKGT